MGVYITCMTPADRMATTFAERLEDLPAKVDQLSHDRGWTPRLASVLDGDHVRRACLGIAGAGDSCIACNACPYK